MWTHCIRSFENTSGTSSQEWMTIGKKTAICINIDFNCILLIDPKALLVGRYEDFLGHAQDILTLDFSGDRINVSKSAMTYFHKGFYFNFLLAPYAKDTRGTVEKQVVY